jgi:uncharacterized lipoprotein YajG
MKNSFFIFFLFLLSGCAVSRDHIALMYRPIPQVQKIAEAEGSEISISVSDSREQKNHVGRKSNGSGIPMASIRCKNQIDELVKEAFVNELKNRGFAFASKDPKTLIHVEIKKMNNRFENGFFSGTGRSETILSVCIQNAQGALQYGKTVIGEGNNPTVLFTTGKNAKIALERSLQDAILQVVEDPEFLQALLKK